MYKKEQDRQRTSKLSARKQEARKKLIRTQEASERPAQKQSDKKKPSRKQEASERPAQKQADRKKPSRKQEASERLTQKQSARNMSGSLPQKETWRAGNMLYPLPVVMVSCACEGEKPNIITVAWAGTVCTNPPMVSISIRPGRHSHDIIARTGEFVINLVTRDLVQACDWCGVRSGRDHDKFVQCGLDAVPGEQMKWAPLIAQSPVNIECRVKQIIPLGSHDMFLAEVVSVHVDQSGMDENGRYDLGRADLVSYSHGEYYALGEKLGTFGYSVKKARRKRSQN